MSRCAVEVPASARGDNSDLLAGVPDSHPPNKTLTMEWLPAPGAPGAPGADPWADDDPHGGWYPP